MRSISIIASVVFLAVSASRGAFMARAQDSKFEFSVPFSKPSRGIADGPVIGTIVLPNNKEQGAVGVSLLSALEAFHLTLTEVEINLNNPFPPERMHTTDIAPLSDDLINKYNSRNSPHLLQDRIIGLRYSVSYKIQNQNLIYEVKSKLFQKGTASLNWTDYSGLYLGDFFAERLKEAIIAKLKENFAVEAQR